MDLKVVAFLGGVAAGKSTLAAALFEALTGKPGTGMNPTCSCGTYGLMGRWYPGLSCPGWDSLKDRRFPADFLARATPKIMLVDSHSATPAILRALPRQRVFAVLVQPPDSVRKERLAQRSPGKEHSPTYFNKIPGHQQVGSYNAAFTGGTVEWMVQRIIADAALVACRCMA